jgi:hypothetical protein
MNTLQLSAAWDLGLDANGNMAMLSGPSAIAQDVASAISTFAGETYFDTTLGIPYYSEVLGQAYAPSLVQALLIQAALTVPEVVKAQAKITGFQNRKVSGVVNVIDITGQALGVTF